MPKNPTLNCGKLASAILCQLSLRADAGILIKIIGVRLRSYSISGDLPILLLQIADPANILLVQQLVQAHAYWRLRLAVDLVIFNEHQGVTGNTYRIRY